MEVGGGGNDARGSAGLENAQAPNGSVLIPIHFIFLRVITGFCFLTIALGIPTTSLPVTITLGRSQEPGLFLGGPS